MRHNLNSVIGILALGLLGAGLGCRTAQQCDSNPNQISATRSGVLVMAHGGSQEWNQAVEQVVEPLRESYPIEIAYGMAKTSTMRAAVERLEEQGVDQIAVVRMFISGESFLDSTRVILGFEDAAGARHDGHSVHASMMPEAHSGMAHSGTDEKKMDHSGMAMDEPASSGGHGMMMEPPQPLETDASFYLSTEGVAATPLIDPILIERVQALSIDPSTESILILAHGPGDDAENERWLADMKRRVASIEDALGSFIEIRCETLREDWPGRRVEAEARIREFVRTNNEAGNRVLVIPFRVAGFGPYAKVLEGLEYTADGLGFCPHPNMTAWIDQTARKYLPSLPTATTGAQAAASGD